MSGPAVEGTGGAPRQPIRTIPARAAPPTNGRGGIVHEALALAAGGLPVFPCTADKKPAIKHGFLDATRDPDIIAKLFRGKGAVLIGVPTGPASGLDVLDLDYRHGATEWEAANLHRIPETRAHSTMSGGRHLLFRSDARVRNSAGRIASGVDVRGGGGYIIMPPSPGYAIVSDAAVESWPTWLLEPGVVLPPPPKERPVSSAGAYVPASSARLEGLRASILANVQRAGDGQKHLQLRNAALALGGIAEQAGFSDAEAVDWLLTALPDGVKDWEIARQTAAWGVAAGRDAPLPPLEDRPRGTRKPNGATHEPATAREPEPRPEPPAAEKAPKAKRRGLNMLILTGRMDTKAWRGAVRLNDMTSAIEVREPFPPTGDAFNGPFRPLRDPIDLLEAVMWHQGNGAPSARKEGVFDAIQIAAHRNHYHPVTDYLDGLKWDGTARVGRLFQHYFSAVMPDEGDTKAHDSHVAYLEHISRCTLVSAVARVKQPGCKVDHLPIIVGRQGANKSKGLRALCPNDAWFTDDLSPDLIERDTKESLLGKWLVELAEIPHVRKEAERVKAFFSRQSDRFRRAYDRTTNDWPRQCIFLGSSNDLEFVDPTGNRRFWPFNVGQIDVPKIIADRDQLWAEAAALYRGGCEWWLPPTLELIAASQQAGYVEADLWDDLIESWIVRDSEARPAGPGKDHEFTLLDVMTGAFGFVGAAGIPKPDQMRATSCLKRLGYRRGPLKRVGKGLVRYWSRPGPRS